MQRPILPGPRPMEFGEIVSAVFNLYGRCFSALVPIILLTTVPLALAAGMLGAWSTLLSEDLTDSTNTSVGTELDFGGGDAALILGLLFLTVILGLIGQQLALAGSIKLMAA